jgi:pimeloyl-ACP methyl ester carboxylesterase
MILATSAEGYIASTAALKQLDYLRRLGGIACPALYIAGEHDGGAPVDAMREMAAATPGGRIEIVSGVAHIGNMEDPATYDRLLTGFLTA